MPTFRVTYRPELNKDPEDVVAERVCVEGSNGLVVLRTTVLVVGSPRDIVVRRLTGSQILSVDPVPEA